MVKGKIYDKQCYSIGEMSAVTGVSISTLRYYDKEQLLVPEVRNEKSGYRYYSGKQLDLLHCIRYLQNYGFSLNDIRTFLDHHDYEWLERTMEENIAKLNAEINDKTKQIKSMESLLKRIRQNRIFQEEGLGIGDNQHIEVVTLKRNWVLSTRYVSRLNANELFFDRCLELQKMRNEMNLFTAGPYIAIFHGGYEKQFENRECDLELCMPVFWEEGSFCENLREFGGELVVGTTHKGPYRNLKSTYEYLTDWIGKHGYRIAGPSYEIYHIDRSTGANESEYITKVYFPVE